MALDWGVIIYQALASLWQGFLVFFPKLVGAIIVFLIGWFVAVIIGKLIAEILNQLKFNKLFENVGWKGVLEKAELKVDASEFIGGIVKWILVIVFLMIAVEILDFVQFADFLKSILLNIPNVIVAALIFVVTVIVVDIIEKVLRVTVEGMKVGYGHMVSVIVKWSIWIFAILAILHQLGVGRPFLETMFQGLIGILVIAFGIAFGLGGKDAAAELLVDLKKKLKE